MKVSLEYIAGFLDGEGTISLIQCHKPKRTYLRPSISIYQTSLPVLKAIQLTLGQGRIHTRRARGEKIIRGRLAYRNKPCSVLMVTGAEKVAEVLDSLLPYLIVKKPQAVLLRKFIEKKDSLSPNQGIEYSEQIKETKR